MKLNRVTPRNAGFTLMELMLVLGIIVLLIVAGMNVGPMVTKQGRETTARVEVGHLSTAILNYQSKHRSGPPSSLESLVASGDLSEKQLKDPWGNNYVLAIPAKRSKGKFDLYSLGNDEVDGTVDDIGDFAQMR